MMHRRTVLGQLASFGAAALWSPAAFSHKEAGAVSPPLPAPPADLELQDGAHKSLGALFDGHATCVQMVFTSCRAICPIQGALFAQAAALLGENAGAAQFLSISIDPDRDDPKALRAFMDKYGAHPRWRAARTLPNEKGKKQLSDLISFLRSESSGPDRHTGQAYFFNQKGELVLRTVDFPKAPELARQLRELAEKKG